MGGYRRHLSWHSDDQLVAGGMLLPEFAADQSLIATSSSPPRDRKIAKLDSSGFSSNPPQEYPTTDGHVHDNGTSVESGDDDSTSLTVVSVGDAEIDLVLLLLLHGVGLGRRRLKEGLNGRK